MTVRNVKRKTDFFCTYFLYLIKFYTIFKVMYYLKNIQTIILVHVN